MDFEAKGKTPDLSTDLLPSGGEVRGSVREIVRALRDTNDWDAVLAVVDQLVAENSTMAQRLARIAARFETSEKVSKAQLVLFADALRRGEGEPELEADAAPDELDTADDRLRAAAGLDDKDADDLAKPAHRQAAAATTLACGRARTPPARRQPHRGAGGPACVSEVRRRAHLHRA